MAIDLNSLLSSACDGGLSIAAANRAIAGLSPEIASSAGLDPSGGAARAFAAATARYVAAIAAGVKSALTAAVRAEYPGTGPSDAQVVAALAADMAARGLAVRSSVVTGRWAMPAGPDPPLALAFGAFGQSGIPAELAFTEVVTLSGSGSRLTATGQPAAASALDPSWPMGSACVAVVPVADAAASPGRGAMQVLANGELDAYAGGGVPASWSAAGDPANLSATASSSSGSMALAITGDGTDLTGVVQVFGRDTPISLPPSQAIAFGLYARLATASGQGTLEVALVDASGAILSGVRGPCVATFDLSRGLGSWGYGTWGSGTWGLPDGGGGWGDSPWGEVPWGDGCGTPYVALAGMLVSPAVVPPGAAFRVRLASPLAAGQVLAIDRVAACLPTTLYPGGPSVAAFSPAGGVPAGYAASLLVRNDRSGVAQQLIGRLYGAAASGVLLPSSPTPSACGTCEDPGRTVATASAPDPATATFPGSFSGMPTTPSIAATAPPSGAMSRGGPHDPGELVG